MWIGAGERRDVDDVAAAALLHPRDRFMTAIEDAEQISFQDRAKIFGRGLLYRFEDADTSVVDENVEPAEFFDCVIDESFHLLVPAHITNQTDRATCFRSIQLTYCLIDLVLMSSANANGHAFANECFGYSTA